ncbi:3'-5' exonuclease, partial [Eisenbergiella tayi]
VYILTMHASKGLEFNTVYIPDCNEGIIPHKKSMKGEAVEEERRMLYVAMTRARQMLTISYVAGTKEEPGFLSRFLTEFGR